MKQQGVFVSGSAFLGDLRGGVQQCTKEYMATLNAAGIELHVCPCEPDPRRATRMMKRLWRSNYFRPFERGIVERVLAMVVRRNAKFVFLNQMNLASIAAQLRALLHADCKIVALSHGLESTDLLHALRLERELHFVISRHFFGRQLLGDTLLREVTYRSSLDLILCLSPFDVELEHWLGARRAVWLPRTITPGLLNWNPHGNRIGFVGTLDHPPNIEGLLIFLRSLSAKASAAIRVRVVGGPGRVGRLLMKRFAIVDYLGELSDDDLRREASTWNCFTNPIFCYPRGCSTKLATAIAWQIPVVTTTPGHRGYDWDRGALSVADNPDEFSDICLKMMNVQVAQQARTHVSEIALSSPSIASVGRKLASLLEMN